MNQPAFERLLSHQLHNRYFVLRHGQSEANEQGVIASSPARGLAHFGLTEHGRDQIRESLQANQQQLAGITKIFSSDFRRTRETADIAATLLGTPHQQTIELRERDFGQWDGQSDQNYPIVWAADAEDPTHQRWAVESVDSVARRMTEFLRRLDQSSIDQTYLLVSHGDPLQILITAVAGRDLRLHRQLDPLRTAELRSLC